MQDAPEIKVWRVIYPPVLYIFICFAIQLTASLIISISGFVNLGKSGHVSASEAIDYTDKISGLLLEYSTLFTIICALASIPVFYHLYNKDQKVRKEKTALDIYKKIQPDLYAYVIILGMSFSLLVSRIIYMLPLDNIIGSYEETSAILFSGSVFLQILSICLIIPILEELIFRGIVYNRAKEYSNEKIAAIISSLMFGVYHRNLMQGLYAFILGLMIVYVYNKYKNFAAPVIFHISANTLAMIIAYSPMGTYISKSIVIGLVVIMIMTIISFFSLVKISEIDNIG